MKELSALGFVANITKETKHRDGSYSYEFTLTENGVSLAETMYKSGMRKVVDFIEKYELIRPDKDSLTQFYPYYIIEQKDVEEFKKENL